MVPVGPICVATGQAGAEIGADMTPTLNCNHEAPYVAHSLRGEGFDASEDGTGRGTPLVPVGVTIHGTDPTVQKVASYDELAQCLRARTPGNIDNSSTTVVQQPVAYGIRTANTSSNGWGIQEECTHTLDCAQGVAVAFSAKDYGGDAGSIAPTQRAMGHAGSHTIGGGHQAVAYSTKLDNTTSNKEGKVYEEYTAGLDSNSPPPALLTTMQVRRLTPRECERLQGLPDDYTFIPYRGKSAADGPRYRAIGNSMAVPVMRWIGERIQLVDGIRG